jgi:hypothetical protein
MHYTPVGRGRGRSLLGLAAGFFVGAAMGAAVGAGYAQPSTEGLSTRPAVSTQLPPCATEDSPGPCLWDASVRGNGVGRSFWRTADGDVIYLT